MTSKPSFHFKLSGTVLSSDGPLTLIAGPCVIESADLCFHVARELMQMTKECGIQLVFKSSFDKANRSSITSYRGPGLKDGLKVLADVKERFNLPILSDIHLPEQAIPASEVCDILQIPAFLCRQTDLLLAAAQTGRIINVKKGQFLAPWDMENIVRKIEQAGNHQIILTDRGTCFGYNHLISDFRSISIMQTFGYPVCFDATHSAQIPGGRGTSSGGQREWIPVLAKASIAAGADMLYMETHPDPDQALSDQACMMPLQQMRSLLLKLKKLYDVTQE